MNTAAWKDLARRVVLAKRENRLHDVLHTGARRAKRRGGALLERLSRRRVVHPAKSDADFIKWAFESVAGRGVQARELVQLDYELRTFRLTRRGLLADLAKRQCSTFHARSRPITLVPMGADYTVSASDWRNKRHGIDPQPEPTRPYPALVLHKQAVVVSAIASMYQADEFIENFLSNITSQTIFPICELIIIDACSPGREHVAIARYRERFDNIVYLRTGTRIGIYEAWNLAIKMARGRYITNTNLDDVRRADSFERQAELLDGLSFVDCVYQDFLYTFDPGLSFDQISNVGIQTQSPVLSPQSLLACNYPGNGPMWRRSIHDDIGFFREDLQSAADYDFWLRCLLAGKTFYKSNDLHIAYFVNPAGMSTKANTPGAREADAISAEFSPRCISPHLMVSDTDFLDLLQALAPAFDPSEFSRTAPKAWRQQAAQRALRARSIQWRHTYSPEAQQ